MSTTAAAPMCARVITTDWLCRTLNRVFAPWSVALLIAGMRTCRAVTVVAAIATSIALKTGSNASETAAATAEFVNTTR